MATYVHHPRAGWSGTARIGRTTLVFKDGVAEAPEDLTRRRWERNGYRITADPEFVDLTALTVPQLREYAAEHGIDVPAKAKKADLIDTIASAPLDPIEDEQGERIVDDQGDEDEPGGDAA